MSYFQRYVDSVRRALEEVVVTDRYGNRIPADRGVELWCRWTRELAESSGTMYFVGNGASAMMASHMAIDSAKNAGFRALAFNDPAFLTAVANDLAFDQVFSYPLRRLAEAGDVLVTVSSSGNSPNVIGAIECARELELKIVTLSGMSEGNASRSLGDLNLYVPAHTYGFVETSHQVLLHCWIDRYMEEFRKE